MNRVVQIHDYLFKYNEKYFIRSLLIAIISITCEIIVLFFMGLWLYIGGYDFEIPQEENRHNYYFYFLILVIIAPVIEKLLLVMIFKISDLIFENKEFLSLMLIPFIAGFAHEFYFLSFFGFFIMSYQYMMYRRNITNFNAYMCTVLTHAVHNFFASLAHLLP